MSQCSPVPRSFCCKLNVQYTNTIFRAVFMISLLWTRVKFSHFKKRCSRYNLILSSFYIEKRIFPKKRPFFQRSSEQSAFKIITGKIFLFDFSPNWTILSIWSHTCFFGLFWPCGLHKGQKAKIFHCLPNNYLFSIQ